MRELTEKEIKEYEMLTANAKQLSFDDLLGGVNNERRKDTYTGKEKGNGKRTAGGTSISRSV